MKNQIPTEQFKPQFVQLEHVEEGVTFDYELTRSGNVFESRRTRGPKVRDTDIIEAVKAFARPKNAEDA